MANGQRGMISIIIPASNEEKLVGRCLSAVLASECVPVPVEVIVVANGCRDATADVARAHNAAFAARDWTLRVLDLPEGGKPGALNAGDAAATGTIRIYLDADVTLDSGLVPALHTALDRTAPAYASGLVTIAAQGSFSRAYARCWARVPFMSHGVPGCGLFAVNAAGRSLWDRFPAIIADDTFVRLHFTPDQRMSVSVHYNWPIAEGFARLVRVRRRQDHGVKEIAAKYPHLLANDDKLPLGRGGALRLFLADPVGFAAYASVALGVRLWPGTPGWSRGR
jgi:glycosyltransferase involved in cell wall biosynthesis